MPFEMFRTHTQPVNLADLEQRFESGASVDVAALKAAGLATRRGHPGQGARPRRDHQAADGARARLLEVRARGHRGRRRHLPGHRVAAGRRSRAGDDPELASRSRRSARSCCSRQPFSRSTGSARSSRCRASPRRRSKQLEDNYAGSNILGFLNLFTGRRAVADRALRARDHAVHHGLDHPAAPDGGLAVAGEAAEGGRGRAGADHAVHALPDRRARRRAGRRLRLPLPLAGQQRRHAGVRRASTPARCCSSCSASPRAACC